MWYITIDSRVKLITSLIFIMVIVQLNSIETLLWATIVPISLLLLARLSIKCFLKRISWIIPFAGAMALIFPFITAGKVVYTISVLGIHFNATEEGIYRGLILILRAGISAGMMINLSLSTPDNQLLKAMESLKVPSILIRIIEFTLRYIQVLKEEVARMQVARKARNYRPGKNLWHKSTIQTIGQLIGVLFLRSLNRGDRVYVAMLSRGYQGQIHSCCKYKLNPLDYCYAAASFAIALVLLSYELGGWQWL